MADIPSLSVVMVTRGRQPLMKYALESLIPQIREEDEFVVSVNSTDETILSNVREVVKSLPGGSFIKVISPVQEITVYEHYRFGFESTRHDCAVLVHDDDLYGLQTLEEIKKGFSHEGVNVVVGGMLKVEIYPAAYRLERSVNFNIDGAFDGLNWLLDQKNLYPPFCFSALALRKSALDLRMFVPEGTALDCLAVAKQAVEGRVYQSKIIFATWMQLPSRTSRWLVIKPNLVSPWKEFLNYYENVGNVMLIQKALKAKKDSLKNFIRMTFIVGVANQDESQISSCIQKIKEINPRMARLLIFARHRWFYRLAGPPLQYMKKIFRRRRSSSLGKVPPSSKDAGMLNVAPDLWTRFVDAAMGFAEK